MDIEKIVREVVNVAEDVGRFIEGERQNFQFGDIEYKGQNDLVSYVDKQAEKALVKKLSEIVPEAGFIAEEGTGKRNDNGLNWVIDPLDGTTNFMHGLPPYSISIGLTDGEEIVLGVIRDIPHAESYWATSSGKAFCNGKEIRVSGITQFEDGLYITGYPYKEFSKYRNFYEIMYHFLTHSHGLRRLGSAAIDLAYVASGRAEGFFEFFLNPWDVAAGSLIVKRAGGLVSDFRGGNNYLFGRELIAGNSFVQSKMQEIVMEYWQKKY